MKKIFLISILFSFNTLAGYVAESKINLCSRTDYTSPSACQEVENETCYKVPNDSGECGIFKFKNLHSEISVNEESCEDQASCETLLASKVCSVNHDPFISEDFSSVYCREVIGKEMVIDQSLKSQKDAEKLASSIFEAGLEIARKLRECGGRVMDLMLVRNQPKQLTVPQVAELLQTYQPIQLQLSSGSLVTAKTAIQAVTADGVLVTESDKTALISEIDKCLGL